MAVDDSIAVAALGPHLVPGAPAAKGLAARPIIVIIGINAPAAGEALEIVRIRIRCAPGREQALEVRFVAVEPSLKVASAAGQVLARPGGRDCCMHHGETP